MACAIRTKKHFRRDGENYLPRLCAELLGQPGFGIFANKNVKWRFRRTAAPLYRHWRSAGYIIVSIIMIIIAIAPRKAQPSFNRKPSVRACCNEKFLGRKRQMGLICGRKNWLPGRPVGRLAERNRQENLAAEKGNKLAADAY